MEKQSGQGFKARFKMNRLEVEVWRFAIYEKFIRKKKDVKIILWDEVKTEDIKTDKK